MAFIRERFSEQTGTPSALNSSTLESGGSLEIVTIRVESLDLSSREIRLSNWFVGPVRPSVDTR